MLYKNKKLKGKPWGGRGRGRGGDHCMEDMMPVRVPKTNLPDVLVLFIILVEYEAQLSPIFKYMKCCISRCLYC